MDEWMVAFVLTSWGRQSQQQQQSDLIILDKMIRMTRTKTAAVPAITMRALGQVLSSQWEGSSQWAWGGKSFIIIHSLTNRTEVISSPSVSLCQSNVMNLKFESREIVCKSYPTHAH